MGLGRFAATAAAARVAPCRAGSAGPATATRVAWCAAAERAAIATGATLATPDARSTGATRRACTSFAAGSTGYTRRPGCVYLAR